jgi:hypothetical protein
VHELRVGPGASASFELRIVNGGSEPERIAIEPIDWTTTADGALHFGPVGSQGARSITRYLSLPQYQFVLAPGATRELSLGLRLPASFSTAPGAYWGGYLVRGSGMSGRGVGPAATVFVYDTIGDPRKHLAITAMRVTQSGPSGAVLSARVQNDGDAYARLTARLLIEQNGRIVQDRDVSTAAMFPGKLRSLTEQLKDLPPGDYRAELSIDYGTDVVLSGATEFRIRP